MNRLPTFLIIGAARAGTTSLHNFLMQHPQIYMSPVKETNFFAFEREKLDYQGPGADYVNNAITTIDRYQALFDGATSQPAIGEACPLYLYRPGAAARISHHIPDAKLIAILRNPVEQAYSHFLYAQRQTLEPLDDFMQALQSEPKRKQNRWQPLFQYSQFPRYYEQLSRYYRHFDRSQIEVFLYEDLESNPADVLRQIYRAIGVEESFVAMSDQRLNAGGIPRNQALQNFVMRPNPITGIIGRVLPERIKQTIRERVSLMNLKKTRIPDDAKQFLMMHLSSDIEQLQTLINRDLTDWMN